MCFSCGFFVVVILFLFGTRCGFTTQSLSDPICVRIQGVAAVCCYIYCCTAVVTAAAAAQLAATVASSYTCHPRCSSYKQQYVHTVNLHKNSSAPLRTTVVFVGLRLIHLSRPLRA